MTWDGPRAFEQEVAADFAERGYRVELTGFTDDWGVDVFATKGDHRLAIQAKMYGSARRVNRRQIFELYGAAVWFDCTGAIVATDGDLMPDAEAAARKLGIVVLKFPASTAPAITTDRPIASSVGQGRSLPSFDDLWSTYVMPLKGATLFLPSGGTNRITSVDWGGVGRITSTGRRNKIPIEPFVWAIERIRERGYVTRSEINEQFENRYSSGVTLILGQIPDLELEPTTTTIRPRVR